MPKLYIYTRTNTAFWYSQEGYLMYAPLIIKTQGHTPTFTIDLSKGERAAGAGFHENLWAEVFKALN